MGVTSKPHSELAERVGDALNTLFGNTDVVYSGSHEAHEDGHAALVSLVEQLETQEAALWRIATATLEGLGVKQIPESELDSNPASEPDSA